jgi:putative membrane protein (TIGR04086 family)
VALSAQHRRAILVGGAVALAVVAPPVLIVRALKPSDLPYQESNLWVVAAAAYLLAFPIGGYVAARRDPRQPYTLGAGAAAIAYATVILIALIRRAVAGSVSGGFFITAGLLATIATSLGVVGGHVASRRAAHEPEAAEPHDNGDHHIGSQPT